MLGHFLNFIHVAFFLLFCCVFTEIFASAPITITGIGRDKSDSAAAGIEELKKRKPSDPIARELLSAMPSRKFKEQELLINEYNRRLELEKIKNKVDPTVYSAFESAASSGGISLSSLISSPGGGGAGGSSGNITPGPDEAAFEEIKRNHADALEKLKSSEQIIQDLERRLGSSAVTAILESRFCRIC